MTANVALLRTAADFRHGIVLPPEEVESSRADVGGLTNLGVPGNAANPWAGATGGIGRTRAAAEAAAIGEALERYAAAIFALPTRRRSELPCQNRLDADAFSLYSPEQRGHHAFPHRALYENDVRYTNVFSVTDNAETWIPAPLVGLGIDEGGVATSTGLAAGPSPSSALLRAVQELIERDALAVTWLHGARGRRVDFGPAYVESIARLGGEAVCIDATPVYSPHPVALVAGHLPLRGTPRVALGAACRETWAAAVEKAFLEWVQGITFAGFQLEVAQRPAPKRAQQLKTFDDHALYYTDHFDEWTRVPLLHGHRIERSCEREAASLSQLVETLMRHEIRILYRELTTTDLADVGICVVRALSPELAPLACDEEWRFLGGTVTNVARRYPWAVATELSFPSAYPHPLG